jgi:protein-tyrosine phosphatase
MAYGLDRTPGSLFPPAPQDRHNETVIESSTGPHLRILTVCTGNICRSALAAALLRRRLGDLQGVTVASAGTMAVAGAPMDARAAEYARRLGADPLGHRARQLTEAEVLSSDLVLAMAAEHRRIIVDYAPSAARRTFTARELARILDDTSASPVAPRARTSWLTGLGGGAAPLSGAAALIDAAASHPLREGLLGGGRSTRGVDDDIPDPYGRSDEEYAAAVGLLVPAIDTIAAALRRVANGEAAR